MTSTQEPKYKVALIGCGRAGPSRAHTFDMHPLCKMAAVADTDSENLELAAGRFDVPGYSTYDEMFAKEQIDIAMAVLPVRPNADAVVASARAGVKAVFCEKPLTAMLSDADRMVEECNSRGIPLATGVVVSSHPDYRKAYAMAASGEIGEVRRINLYEGNGQMGTHGLNLARKFAGTADVDWVVGWVSGDPQSDYEEDYGEGTPGYGDIGGYIRFSNGVECFSSYSDVRWRGIEVVGTRGVIYNSNNTGRGLHLLRVDSEGEPGPGSTLKEVDGVFEEQMFAPRGYGPDGWQSPGEVMPPIVEDIVNSLETGAELKVSTGDDMRHALEIAIALRESHRQGRVPVKLPLEDRTLVMYPEKSRWHYKKELMGRKAYMDQLAQQVKA